MPVGRLPLAADACDARASKGTIPALDGLRGIAILLVLAHNFNLFEGSTALAGRLVDAVMNAGWVGVQLFFVLSGFLITGILLDTKKAPNGYRAFFGRRMLRIFPLYYGALFVAFVVLPHVQLSPELEAGREHQVYLWTYLSNWVQPYGRTVALAPHFWSLAVEEQFYLAWPFVVRNLSSRRLLILTSVVIVLAIAVRVVLRVATGNVELPYMWTVCRLDALAFGAAAAVLMRSKVAAEWLMKRERALTAVGIGGLALTFLATGGLPRTSFLMQSAGYTVLSLLFTLWLLGAVVRHVRVEAEPLKQRASWLSCAPLRAFGKYSYGIYVFHLPIHLLVGLQVLGGPVKAASGPLGAAYFAGATALTFALAYVSYHLLEKHFLRLKRWFTPTVVEPSGTCNGDSGGTALWNDGGGERLVGIQTRSDCGR